MVLSALAYLLETHSYTNRHLNYASHHPPSHKRAVVCTLTHRASSHSSQLCDKVRESRHVISSLKLNSYLDAFITACQLSPATAAPMSTSTPEFKGIALIPYVQRLSERVQHILTPLQVSSLYGSCYPNQKCGAGSPALRCKCTIFVVSTVQWCT